MEDENLALWAIATSFLFLHPPEIVRAQILVQCLTVTTNIPSGAIWCTESIFPRLLQFSVFSGTHSHLILNFFCYQISINYEFIFKLSTDIVISPYVWTHQESIGPPPLFIFWTTWLLESSIPLLYNVVFFFFFSVGIISFFLIKFKVSLLIAKASSSCFCSPPKIHAVIIC